MRRGRRGIETLVTDHHLPGAHAAGGGGDRESECARKHVPSKALAGVGCRVLRDGGA